MAKMARAVLVGTNDVSARYAIYVEFDPEPSWLAWVHLDRSVDHRYEGNTAGASRYSGVLHLARKHYLAGGEWPANVSYQA